MASGRRPLSAHGRVSGRGARARATLGDRRLAPATLAFAATIAFASCQSARPPSSPALEYALTIDLRSDGTASIDERVVLDGGEAPQALRLPISAFRIDGVAAYSLLVDGAPADGPGITVEASPGGGVVIATERMTGRREIRQRYEARGVLELQGARALFMWPAVPPTLGAGAATIDVRFPPGGVAVAAPTVDRDGWRVETEATGARLTATGAAVTDEPWFYLDLVLDDLTGEVPAWQALERRARLLTPAFIAAGLFLVVVGIGILIMLRIQYPAGPDVTMDEERPAVARALRRAGLIVMASAALVAAVVPIVVSGLGWPPYAVPIGLAILGVMVYWRGQTFPVSAEAGVLHSPRFRQHREP